MIPLGDSEAPRRFAPANSALILANIGVFALEVRLGPAAAMLGQFAMVPAQVAHLDWRTPIESGLALATLVTSLFLHAGVLHIAGNMLYLFVFGPAVESRTGHLRFLGFYLAAGVVACLAMVAMAPGSPVPVIGASGAIAGVLGAYFMLYPRGRIRTILPAYVIPRMVQVPAIFYLLIWFALQLYSGITSGIRGPLIGGVAWWAHVGGFLFGVAAAPLIVHKPNRVRYKQAKKKRITS
ncbi:MAG TPA: rhomboid family intramembrane serine protease [Candidatus Binataceae bacterium]|nr:rhomboid family intramembrane serine protease [Candidatus Binataceae bacterium]